MFAISTACNSGGKNASDRANGGGGVPAKVDDDDNKKSDDTPKDKNDSNNNNKNSQDSNLTADEAVCAIVKDTSKLPSAFKFHKTALCSDSLLEELRDITYAGSGEPEVKADAKERSNGKSTMQLYSSFITPASPKEHFELLKLQMLNPDDFESEGYEVGVGVSYTILNKSSSNVSFQYKNESEAPAVVANYKATSKFIELGNDAFMVLTELDESLETVEQLKAVVIIFEAEMDGDLVTHVYSVSDQEFDNNNDHDQTISKSKKSSAKELRISYRNSKKFAGK